MQDGLIAGIKVLAPGSGYAKYKKLTGSVKLGTEDDLLLGIQTDFMNELEVGQPVLFGQLGSDVPDISLGTYEIMGFQSMKELLLDREIELNSTVSEYSIFTYGTKILVKGGMDTAAEPIRLQRGQELSLGMYAVDPEGTSIRPDGFTSFVNGQVDESVVVQGSGPFYRVLWSPPDLGDYNLRVQVADLDGASGVSQPLLVRVAAGFEPTIKMVSTYKRICNL